MKLTKLALACALTGSLAACGGGSSDTVVQKDRELSGVAAKGLIKGGVVKVYSYSADGTKSANPIVTGKTSKEDGSYSVRLGDNIGLFTVEVGADADTKMYDEATKQDISMPTTMVLRSLVQLDNAAIEAITAHVTPFTDMVVTVAKEAGPLTAANADYAQDGVIEMLGFDPLLTKPIMAGSANANNTAAEKSQRLRLETLSEIANDTNSASKLGCDEADDGERIKCVVDKTTGSATITDGPTGSTIDMSVEANDATKTAFETVLAKPDNAEIAKEVAPTFSTPAEVPATPAIVDSITAAKALFASLRSNINAWSAAAKTGGALNNQAEALKADFDTAIAPLDKDLADWILLSERGVVFYKNYVAGGNVGASSQAVLRNGNEIGKCFLYADAADTTEVTSGVAANNVFCRLSKEPVAGTEASLEHTTSATPAVTTNLTRQQFTKSIQLTPVSSSTTSFSYTARARMETAYFNRDVNGSVENLSIDNTKTTIGDAGTGTISYAKNGNTVTDVVIAGDMPARTNSLGVKKTDKETWNVSFVRTVEADNVTNKFAFSGAITALNGGVSVSSIALKDGSFIRADIASQELKEVNLALEVTGASSKVAGTLSMSNFSADKNGNNYIPTDLKFIGSFTNASSEFFNGTLTAKASNYVAYDNSLPRSTTNFAPTSGSFAGILRIPARPELKLTLSANNPALDVANFSAQYDDGTNTITIDSTNAKPKVVNISSASGVSMQLKEGVNTADVMKNSSIIATFNRSTGMIDYADGSGESLK